MSEKLDGAGAITSMTLPFATASAGVARRRLQTWLDGLGYDGPLADDCRVVITELVGNAVRHAHPLPDGTVRVAWTDSAGEVDIAVTDGGSESSPCRLHLEPMALSGRGLLLVEALAARWWVDDAAAGTTVHARLASA